VRGSSVTRAGAHRAPRLRPDGQGECGVPILGRWTGRDTERQDGRHIAAREGRTNPAFSPKPAQLRAFPAKPTGGLEPPTPSLRVLHLVGPLGRPPARRSPVPALPEEGSPRGCLVPGVHWRSLLRDDADAAGHLPQRSTASRARARHAAHASDRPRCPLRDHGCSPSALASRSSCGQQDTKG
jgi:hypothetical protein